MWVQTIPRGYKHHSKGLRQAATAARPIFTLLFPVKSEPARKVSSVLLGKRTLLPQELQDVCACLLSQVGYVQRLKIASACKRYLKLGENAQHQAIVVTAILLPLHPLETRICAHALK